MKRLDLFTVRQQCEAMVRRGRPDAEAQRVINKYVLPHPGFAEQLHAMSAITQRNPHMLSTAAFALWVRNNDERLIRHIENAQSNPFHR